VSTLRGKIDRASDQSLLVVAIAIKPRLARLVYASGYASPRRVARQIVIRFLIIEATRQWVMPRAASHTKRWNANVADLTERLGRQPTPEEISDGWRRSQTEWKAAGRPR
jgi:hypothetical protein